MEDRVVLIETLKGNVSDSNTLILVPIPHCLIHTGSIEQEMKTSLDQSLSNAAVFMLGFSCLRVA